jgi:hypothetical protein
VNLEQLTELGGVVPGDLVPQDVTWNRIDDNTGEEVSDTFKVFVRRLAYIDQERMFRMAGLYDKVDPDNPDAEALLNEVEQKSINAALIATAIRLGDEGEETMPYETACSLKPSLAQAFIEAVHKVNHAPRKKKARSPRSNLARAGAQRSGREDDRGSKAESDAS